MRVRGTIGGNRDRMNDETHTPGPDPKNGSGLVGEWNWKERRDVEKERRELGQT